MTNNDPEGFLNDGTVIEEAFEEECLVIEEVQTQLQTDLVTQISGHVAKIFDVLSSGVLLPDPFRNSPYARQILIGIVVMLTLLPIKLYFFFVFSGFILGYSLMIPVHDESPLLTIVHQHYQNWEERIKHIRESNNLANKPTKPSSSLAITPKIDASLEILLERLVKSVIDPWFMQINKSGQREFQSCVGTAIDAAIMTLINTIHGLHKDSLTLFIYGLTNALIVHMQEFKRFEGLHLNPAAFLSSPEAKRHFHGSTEAEANHLKQIVSVLLKKLLPKQESQSIIVVSLLKEILASGVLWSAMDRCCEPDFINLKIVESLREKLDLGAKLEPGWNLVVIKTILASRAVIKGQNMPKDNSGGGLYCLIHLAGRKIKTRRIASTSTPLWNETFQFKISEKVMNRLKIHIQLLQDSYVGQDASLGFAKVTPEIQSEPKQSWLKFNLGELFVESMILTPTSPPVAQQSLSNSGRPAEEYAERSDLSQISMEQVLQHNELFMEFHDFLTEFKAPPYLQFLMSLDAFRQFTAMEIGVDPKIPEAIDNYFKTSDLTPPQVDQLKMIRHDAMDLFKTHFAINDSTKYPIPINSEILSQLERNLARSDRVEGSRYAGGPIGPNLFIPAYNWIYGALAEVYFSKFKESSHFKKLNERNANFVAANIDDDRASIVSIETSNGPSGTSGLNRRQSLSNIDSFESEPNEAPGMECDDTEMDIKKISTAISILRQQLALIMEKMESADVHDLEALKKSKRDLEKQISSYLNLIQSKESDKLSQNEDFWLDLRNVVIRMRPSREPTTPGSLFSSDPVFDVEVLRSLNDGGEAPSSMTLSVVSRAYSDFESLHRKLRKEFPKLSKINFPQKDASPSPHQVLESYMQLLTSDEFIRQSQVLREFVTLDSDLESKTLASTAGHLVEAVVGKRVKGVLSSATSLLSGSSGKSKEAKFYETRDNHTTSELCPSSDGIQNFDLHRSRSTSSFIQDTADNTGQKAAYASLPTTPSKTPSMNVIAAAEIKTPKIEVSNPAIAHREKSTNIFSVDEFTEAEMDMLLETAFNFINETFDLKEPSQWLRRKVLSVSKQLLKQAYGDTFSKSLTERMNEGLQEDAFLKHIEVLTNVLWPNGVFIKDVPPPRRSLDQQLSTQIEARILLLKHIPGPIQSIAGRYNAVSGMNRMFSLLQHKEFNKLLFLTFLDITIKILFAE